MSDIDLDDFYSDDPITVPSIDSMIVNRTVGLSTEVVIHKIIELADALSGNKLYPYQRDFAYRICESVLEREQEEITALFARQTGKSQTLAALSASLMVVMPELAKQFPNDDRFRYTDPRSGAVRSYESGFWIGIFAPKRGQAGIIFSRIKGFFSRDTAQAIFREAGLVFESNNGDTVRLSNGSSIFCSTASDQANIEGYTLHLGILEESQDISDEKASKSIAPMLAATGGTVVKIGTANARKSHFYNSIRTNERRYLQGAKKNHFFVDWTVAAKYNTLYERYIKKEMIRLGERSDEFQMAFMCLADGSLIHMADGSVIPIEEVRTGDLIINENGSTARVSHTRRKRPGKPVVNLKVSGIQRPLTITSDHKVKTLRGWVPAGELTSEDWMVSPVGGFGSRRSIPVSYTFANKSSDLHRSRMPTEIELTPDFMRVCGLFVAEGFTCKSNMSVGWALDRTRQDLRDLVTRSLAAIGLSVGASETDSVCSLTTGCVWLRKVFRESFGTDCYTKRIPSWVFECPEDLVREFILGYLQGDGCYSPSSRVVKASSVSEGLCWQLCRLLERSGVRPSFRVVSGGGLATILGRTVETHPLYEVAVYSCPSSDPYSQTKIYRNTPPHRVDGNVVRKVESVSENTEDVFVNDISVEGASPSFLTVHGVVHNCRFMLQRGLAVSEGMFNNRCVTQGPFSNFLVGPRPGMHYAAGIDFGKIHDSTFVIVLEVDWDHPRNILESFDPEHGEVVLEIYGKHVVDILEMQGDDYEAQFVEIRKFLEKWRPERIALDYTGVGVALGDKARSNFPYADVEFVPYSLQSIDQIGRQFLSDVHTGMITWPGGEEIRELMVWKQFRGQMLDLEKEYRNGGLLHLHHPDIRGAHDDAPQATMLAIHAAIQRPFGGEVEELEENIFRAYSRP